MTAVKYGWAGVEFDTPEEALEYKTSLALEAERAREFMNVHRYHLTSPLIDGVDIVDTRSLFKKWAGAK